MFLLVFSAIGGGLITFALTLSDSIWLAALAAPFGGSLTAAAAAIYMASRSTAVDVAMPDLETQADNMVTTLRGASRQERAVVEAVAEAPGKKVA